MVTRRWNLPRHGSPELLQASKWLAVGPSLWRQPNQQAVISSEHCSPVKREIRRTSLGEPNYQGQSRRERPELSHDVPLPPAGTNLEQLERNLVMQALERTKWNQTKAAALLGLNRDQIRYRIEKFGLSK